MKFLRFILLFILAFIFYFNGSTQEKKGKKGFSFGILFSPDYSYRYLHSEKSENNWVQIRNEMESARLGFTTGIALRYQLKKRFVLESGIQFSDKGEKMVVTKNDFSDAYGNPVNDPLVPNKATTIYSYQYLDIPFKLNWFFLEQKFKFFLSAGVSANIFIDGSIKNIHEFNDRTEDFKSDIDMKLSPVNLAAIAGVGVEHDFSNQIRVRLEPVFRHSVTPIADTTIKGYLYSFGINIVLLSNL